MTELNKKILTLVRESDRHMSAEEVYISAKERGIRVSVASVYRILAKLSDEGMIRRLSRPGSPDFFDGNTQDHGHTICPVCGNVEDISLPGLKARIEEITGGSIEGYELSVSCVCPKCRRKQK